MPLLQPGAQLADAPLERVMVLRGAHRLAHLLPQVGEEVGVGAAAPQRLLLLQLLRIDQPKREEQRGEAAVTCMAAWA